MDRSNCSIHGLTFAELEVAVKRSDKTKASTNPAGAPRPSETSPRGLSPETRETILELHKLHGANRIAFLLERIAEQEKRCEGLAQALKHFADAQNWFDSCESYTTHCPGWRGPNPNNPEKLAQDALDKAESDLVGNRRPSEKEGGNSD